MCGIAGYVNLDGAPASRSLLGTMIETLQHRGPDGHGAEALGPVGLAHARLSIIDLAGGVQPMASGSLWITFNGEIYNYLEIKEDLQARGHTFRTSSDTEVILRAYAEFGVDCVQRFNGQFAFAIWDADRRRLFAARDRVGKKPFYYAHVGQAFVFGSELKALTAHPAVSRKLSLRALDQIMTFWCTVPPGTILEDVLELPPGCMLELDGTSVRVTPYWRLEYQDPEDGTRSEAEYAEELRELLIDAVRLRALRSDVPVGAYLSGGLDSTAITAFTTRFTDTNLHTFSVTFDHPEFDESQHQRRVVSELGLHNHREVLCRADDIGRVFPAVIRHTEQPIVRTAPAPLFILSGLVRQHDYKVVLTGEGADEILGGYDIFKEAKVRRFCAERPDSRLRPLLLKRLYPYMPSIQTQSPAYLRAFFHAEPAALADPFFSHRPRWSLTARIKAFLSSETRQALQGYDAIDEVRTALPPEFRAWAPFCQGQFLETSMLLPGYILSSQGDRVQMAHSIEGRCPFLDYRLVEFASRLPPRFKMKALSEKYLLKRATADVVPTFLNQRPKQPYRSMDAPSFFDADQRRARFGYVDELLSPARLRAGGLFDPVSVGHLVEKAKNGGVVGVKDNMALVTVLSTQLVAAQLSGEQF
jgi:asparagine synthase (glutamine-hydrolysing)